MARKQETSPRILEIYKIIGDNIRRRRGVANMKQQDLADKSGVSRGTIVAAEDGQGCRLENLIKLADALGCSLPDLFISEKQRGEVSYMHIMLLEQLKDSLIGKK